MNKALLICLAVFGSFYIAGLAEKVINRNKFPEKVVDDVAFEVLKQMKSMRKVSIANFMDSEAKLNFAFKGEDWDMNDDRCLGPQQKTFAPYFMAGVLSVTCNENTVSVDISDVAKEYVFSVQSDGRVIVDVVDTEPKTT
jgi:hypothetical protein